MAPTNVLSSERLTSSLSLATATRLANRAATLSERIGPKQARRPKLEQ